MSARENTDRLGLLQGTLDLLIRTLIPGPQQGQGIVHAIQQTSDDELPVEPGALYPALTLRKEPGLIAAEWEPPPTIAGRDSLLSPGPVAIDWSTGPRDGDGWLLQSEGFRDRRGAGLSERLARAAKDGSAMTRRCEYNIRVPSGTDLSGTEDDRGGRAESGPEMPVRWNQMAH